MIYFLVHIEDNKKYNCVAEMFSVEYAKNNFF